MKIISKLIYFLFNQFMTNDIFFLACMVVLLLLLAGCAPVAKSPVDAGKLFIDTDRTPSPINPEWEGRFIFEDSNVEIIIQYDAIIGAYSGRSPDNRVTIIFHLDYGNFDFAHAILCVDNECYSTLLKLEDGCFEDVFSNWRACHAP